MGHIGCGQRPNNTVTVTREGIGAPQPVNIVVNGNNGMVCGPDGTTTLVAMNPNGSGTVLWFKNGVKAVKNTDYTVTTTDPSYVRIEVGTGDWFAVVTDGTTCYSRPSQTVSVIENLESGQLDKFSIAYPAFCAGGTVLLSVSGGNTTYTYTWYANNTQIGVGSSVLYTVPSDVSPVVIRCRATLAGSCAREAIAIETIDAGTIPSPPIIGGSMVLCDGTGTLNVRPSDTSTGTYEYAWYLNNALMGTGQQLPITSGGTYYATVAKDGCTSPMVSRNIPMVSSAAPVIELVSYAQTPGKVNLGDKVKYEVNVKAGGPVNGYQWALENASLAPGYNLTDATIYVIYDQTTGDASVRVTAGNQCGDSSPAIRPVQVGEDCAAVTDVRSQDATTKNVLTGFSASLGAVNALFDEGNPPRTFQWYTTVDQKNNTPADDMPIAGAVDNVYTTPVYDAAGTYYYYCKVANAGTNCSDKFGNSAVYTVKVTVLPTTPGSGTFTGRTCFDINKSNFGGDCGSQEMRAYYMADFANLGPVTYTFTASASGTKSNLRFWVVDPEECVSSYSGGKEGTIANNEVITLTVNYKTSLSADGGLIFGRTQANAAQLTIYAIYNNGTQDVSVPLKVRIQDCSCCGAYMADGKWKAFMCHNLGADYTLDPFTPAQGLNGDYYQWGRPTPAASPDALYGPWVTTNPSNTAWSTGSRTANDPCPPGSHVPKLTDFGFASKNTLRYTPASTWTNSPTNYTSGMHVGEHLYLPAAGYRSSASGALTNHGATGYYYTSNVAAANDAHETRFSMSGPPAPVIGMSLGESIRCISL
ncbi:hypothetical protein IR083_24410 [Dysgonomonas sp. GY75]|uniref:hypothetical protein n=1 Tax=Dysgonomonas sp. GY75 TaxID=2780419 RepID=UPI0018842929|nr:hypothetical protein [Dysgonomonas sp. GY75]MBF0651966.1 hypothetical protein [Dysgonomonas sp. GY75]